MGCAQPFLYCFYIATSFCSPVNCCTVIVSSWKCIWWIYLYNEVLSVASSDSPEHSFTISTHSSVSDLVSWYTWMYTRGLGKKDIVTNKIPANSTGSEFYYRTSSYSIHPPYAVLFVSCATPVRQTANRSNSKWALLYVYQ